MRSSALGLNWYVTLANEYMRRGDNVDVKSSVRRGTGCEMVLKMSAAP